MGKTRALVVQGGDRSNESSQHITEPTDFQGCRWGLATSKGAVPQGIGNLQAVGGYFYVQPPSQSHGESGRWVSSTASTAKSHDESNRTHISSKRRHKQHIVDKAFSSLR